MEKKILSRATYTRSKINKRIAAYAIIFCLIFGTLTGMLGSVIAPVGQQHNIYDMDAQQGLDIGSASSVLDASKVTGWIDGVMYGLNITSTSEMDLYVDGDTWGVPNDDAVKDGGYDGDTLIFFLDYNPMDYYLNVSHLTDIFQEGDYEDASNMFFNRTDLAPSLTTLRQVKINEILLDPSDGMAQYVIIYDPGRSLGINNITDYYLQKDNNVTHSPYGETFDFSTHIDDIIDMGNGYYYINLTSDLVLNESDELKLVWKNPHIPNMNPALTGPGNGTDIVVDRVEWGNYINFFSGPSPLVRDYDNTTIPDFEEVSSLLGTGSSMIRTDDKISSGYSGNGTDTDNCFEDFKVLDTATWRPKPGDNPIYNNATNEYFNTIQAAINDSDTVDGDTITVAAGTYTEDVEINKSISLIGEDPTTTTIQGMVILNMKSIDLQNFKIENPADTSVSLNEVYFTNLQNLWLEDNGLAILLVDSNNVTIQDCLIRNNIGKGIEIKKGASGFNPDNITVKNNTIINNTYGIFLNEGINSLIINNTFSKNREYGLYISSSTNIRIYNNNIIKNTIQAFDIDNNKWDNNYPSGGNFWSDYTGNDQFSGSNQDMPGNDEIGDTNYTIDSDSVDNYPLKSPIGDCTFLYEGRNLISLPFIQSDSNLVNVLNSVGVSYDFVQWYNASDLTDPWKHNIPSKPSHMNDLESIDHKMSFWIHITEPVGVLLRYPGIQPIVNQEITLYPGWNQVGYPSLNNMNRTKALNNINFSSDVDSIWTHDSSSQNWMELDESSDSFVVGNGYWIHSKVTKTWIIPL